jgi:hypothetical protein
VGRNGVSASVPVPAGLFTGSRTIDHSAPERPGRLSVAQLDSIAGRVHTLRAEPNELYYAVGDTARVADDVRILALDSAGTVLGELPIYDFQYRGALFRVLGDGRVHFRRRGAVRFQAIWPRPFWRHGTMPRPQAEVAIFVEPAP